MGGIILDNSIVLLITGAYVGGLIYFTYKNIKGK